MFLLPLLASLGKHSLSLFFFCIIPRTTACAVRVTDMYSLSNKCVYKNVENSVPLHKNKYRKDGVIRLVEDRVENVFLYEVWLFSSCLDICPVEIWDKNMSYQIDTDTLYIPRYFNRYIGTYLNKEEAMLAYNRAVDRYLPGSTRKEKEKKERRKYKLQKEER